MLGYSMRSKNTVVASFVAGASALVLSACLDSLADPDPRLPGKSLARWSENLRLGSKAWDEGPVAADSDLSGYGLPLSLQDGDTLHLFVSGRRGPIAIQIYRMGWYGGAGGRLVDSHSGLPAVNQGQCTAGSPGPSICNWSESDRFVVDSWIPGVYLVRFTDALGRVRSAPFVVRSLSAAAFTVILPFATYQAYNQWGGVSLYAGPGSTHQQVYANRAVKVTFARPFSDAVVQGQFVGVDYPLVRWLERNSYDVNYTTDYDFHLGVGVDQGARGWLFAGHSEYWTWPMWLRANAARDQGINLGFLGGNDIYWLSRFETVSVAGLDVPVLVCYRDASQDPLGMTPGLATVLFRSPPNNTPENSLVGVMSSEPSLVRGSPVDLVVDDASDSLMAGTGLTAGEHIPRVAGWEADRTIENGLAPPGIHVLFHSPFISAADSVTPGLMESTVYRWQPSGALVFAAGEPGFSWGLETFRNRTARPPLQRLLENILQAFIANRN
jgi:hypothetical protein